MQTLKHHPLWQYRHWLLLWFLALILVASEVIEHRPNFASPLEGDFVAETILLGIVFPIGGSATLGWLDRFRVRGTPESKASAARRVLVVETELLGWLLKHVLSKEPDLVVLGTTPPDAGALRDVILHAHPDVVVVDGSVDLAGSSALPLLLRDFPDLRIIVVSAMNEWAHIYDSQHILIKGKSDLTELVRGV